jgi:hypothetical protein
MNHIWQQESGLFVSLCELQAAFEPLVIYWKINRIGCLFLGK